MIRKLGGAALLLTPVWIFWALYGPLELVALFVAVSVVAIPVAFGIKLLLGAK
jgi:hypothetical protein